LISKSFNLSIYKSSLAVFISRIFGLLRDTAIAAFFGANKLTDIFFIAFAIPNLFRAFFAEGALSSAFVPILSDKFVKDKKLANKYISDLMFALLIITLIILLIFIVFSKYIILIFMPGYYNDKSIVTIGSHLLIILMPYLPIITVCGLFSGYLNINKIYFIPHSSTVLLNLSMITGAIFGGYLGGNIYILSYSVGVGGLLQLLYIFYFSRKMDFHFQIDSLKNFSFTTFFNNFDADVKKTFYLVIPSILGLSINQLNFVVGRILASFLKEGSISYLYYANRLYQLPIGVFSVAIGVVSLTELSLAYSKNRPDEIKKILDNAVLVLSLFILPSFIGLIILSKELVTIIYLHFNFTKIDMINTSIALQMYTVGLIFISLVNIFTRAFHSKKDLVTPVKISFFAFILNIMLTVILMRFLSHAGIALASSIASAFNAIFLYIYLKEYSFDFRKYSYFLLKVIISSIVMMLCLLGMKAININVLLNVFICVVVYFLMLKIFKINIREFKV
jgi:putative peptidoglycan lipid II flippase